MRGQVSVKKTLSWWCVFGLVSVVERVWHTSQKKYLRLLPEAIGVRARGRSMRLERVLTDFGCEHSFLHAAARVREHYGFEISASAVRESTLKHAQRAHQVLEKQYQQPFRILPSAGPARGRRGRWEHDLHGGAGETKGQKTAGLEGNSPDGSTNSGQNRSVLRRHLW